MNNSLGPRESCSICFLSFGLLYRYNISTSENKYHFSKHQTNVSSFDCFEIKPTTSTNNDIITLNWKTMDDVG